MRRADDITAGAPRLVMGPGRGHPLAPLLARLRAPWLDRQLVAGVESWRSPVHAARSRQLTSERTRRMLARSLEQLVEAAEEPTRVFRGPVIRPSRARVREARPVMLTLAARLRGAAPVNPQAIAALKDLLADGGGPVYTNGPPEAVKLRLQAIEEALDAQD